MLKEKIALVTGASRGIGRVVALELARQGATVIGTATTAEGAAAITHAFETEGLKGKGACLDVREQSGIETLLAEIEQVFGTPTILVNNAGVTSDNLTMRMKEEEWDRVIDTNLKAVFSLAKALMRGMMKAREGRIINITSVVGHTGNAGQANYCAAKAGVEGMSKALARELGSRNITVNCVAPGLIDTDMTRQLGEDQKAGMLKTIPLGRLGVPEDIAAAVCFLASPGASYVTGTTLHVNGGMFMD